jgi:hypothetical protein
MPNVPPLGGFSLCREPPLNGSFFGGAYGPDMCTVCRRLFTVCVSLLFNDLARDWHSAVN